MDLGQKENLKLIIKRKSKFYELFMAKKRYCLFHGRFEEGKVLSVCEIFCFELIKLNSKALRREDPPSSHLNNLYRRTGSFL